MGESPDILIIPECECPKKLLFGMYTPSPSDIYWHGENKDKGIGVFTYGDFKIKPLEIHNPNFRFVIPLHIYNKEFEFVLLAVWCQKPYTNDNYGVQLWNAINYYSDLLNHENIIIAGDFNSSSIWDKPSRQANHTNIVDFLANKNIQSCYHNFHNQVQGKEKDPTLFMYRKQDKPYHIDYCFVSSGLLKMVTDVRVGTYERWTLYSDHKPLSVTFKLNS